MEVTDEKRREVANRLRTARVTDTFAGTYARYSDLNSEFVWRLAEALADVDGGRLHGFNRRQLMDTLADLIDRPTCGI